MKFALPRAILFCTFLIFSSSNAMERKPNKEDITKQVESLPTCRPLLMEEASTQLCDKLRELIDSAKNLHEMNDNLMCDNPEDSELEQNSRQIFQWIKLLEIAFEYKQVLLAKSVIHPQVPGVVEDNEGE